MLITVYALLVAITMGVVIIGYRLLRYPEIGVKRRFSVRTLAQLEGSLPDLRRVIVVADKVEDPENDLRAAVKQNFAKDVQYLFLVSHGRGREALKGYVQIFKVLAGIVAGKEFKLVDVQELPYEWPNYPYVFYLTQGDGAKEAKVVAFRGNQKREGIADFYTPVHPIDGHTVALAVLSGAPQPIVIIPEEFEDGAKVVPKRAGKEDLGT